MGAWGSGVFENDTALDYLGNLVDKLVLDLEADLARLDDGILERPFGSCIAILSILAKSTGLGIEYIPLVKIDEWKVTIRNWIASVAESESADRNAWVSYGATLQAELDALREAIGKNS